MIIAGAGGAAHLPGMLAAVTPLPVIGVPVPLKYLDGLDSLLSIVQMPAGVPVATVAIGNARNAGLLAVRILAATDPELQQKMVDFQAELKTSAEEKGRTVRDAGVRRAQGRFLSRELAPERLVGLDVARCLALLGMVATHVLAPRDADGTLSFAQALAGGRAAALFAVLAGVSLALMTGRREPVRGRERAGPVRGDRGPGAADRPARPVPRRARQRAGDHPDLLRRAVPARAARSSGCARLPCWPWPLAGWSSRRWSPRCCGRTCRTAASPARTSTSSTSRASSSASCSFTGYYPVVPWLAYLLVGMAVGRMDLSRRRVQAWLAGGGAALAVAGDRGVHALTSRPSVDRRRCSTTDGRPAGCHGSRAAQRISGGMYGNTPTGGAWEWLLVVAPHSTTPFDLAQTIGSALAVIGRCLLLVGALDTAGFAPWPSSSAPGR